MPLSSSRFDLVSCWSKAGVGTSIVLEYSNNSTTRNENDAKKKIVKSPRLVFDLGATPCFDDAIQAGVVLISHGHMDHIGAIFSHARAHSMIKSGSPPPTYYVPLPLVPQLEQARDAMMALDATTNGTTAGAQRNTSILQMNIVGVQPGDEFILPIKKHLNDVTCLFGRAFGVDHAGCPAVGYVVGSRYPPRLKEEYRGLNGLEIRKLIQSGVSIKSDPIDVLEVAYTGDTCANGIMQQQQQTKNSAEVARSTIPPTTTTPTTTTALKVTNTQTLLEDEDTLKQRNSCLYRQQAFQAPLIFCEMTLLENTEKMRQLSVERGHMHICDLMPVLTSHGWNSELESSLLSYHHENTKQVEEENENETKSSRCKTTTTEQLQRQRHRHLHLVLLHLSGRYSATNALDQIALVIPKYLFPHCSVAISALLTDKRKDGRGAYDDSKEEWNQLMNHKGCVSLLEYTKWVAETKCSPETEAKHSR